MPFRIQRLPKGLGDLLTIFGGVTPSELEDRVRGTVELLQMYALQQLTTAQATNAALAEGTAVSVVLSATNWTVLFAIHGFAAKSATCTALQQALSYNRGLGPLGQTFVASKTETTFGATETGNCVISYHMPYPMLMPPGSLVANGLQILGTDATMSTTVKAEFGVIG